MFSSKYLLIGEDYCMQSSAFDGNRLQYTDHIDTIYRITVANRIENKRLRKIKQTIALC